MWRGIAVIILALTSVVLLIEAVSLDPVITKQLEEVIKEDELILSLQHIKPRRRLRGSIETLFAVDFPNSQQKFVLMLDRRSKRVIIETVEDERTRNQHFTVDNLNEDTVVKSLVLFLNQTQPNAHVSLYADCVAQGKIATPRSMRDMFSKMKNPELQLFRERKYTMEVDGKQSLRKVLSRNSCPSTSLPTEPNPEIDFDDIGNSLENDPNVQAIQSDDYPYRGDIPSVGDLSTNSILDALNALIKAVNTLTHTVREQHNVIDRLRQILESCDICKKQDQTLPSCATHPPNCFTGVECRDTPAGPRCGRCPYGYAGNGYDCTRIRTCQDSPCFKNVPCRDTGTGYECGSCPPGYEGNGEQCVKTGGCEYNPCHPGVQCVPIEIPPFYRCSGCPAGLSGNGTTCIDVDECDLAQPCHPDVECINLNPGYRCGQCPAGYTGSSVQGYGLDEAHYKKQRCYDINECTEGYATCGPHLQCVNTEGSYECRCKSGQFESQTSGCQIDEGLCDDGRTRCHKNADCIHAGYGNYRCKCKVGFAGDGTVCGPDKDIDRWPDYDLGCQDARCRKVNSQQQQFSQYQVHRTQTQGTWRTKRSKLHDFKHKKDKLSKNKHDKL